jgi:hypothetical protein
VEVPEKGNENKSINQTIHTERGNPDKEPYDYEEGNPVPSLKIPLCYIYDKDSPSHEKAAEGNDRSKNHFKQVESFQPQSPFNTTPGNYQEHQRKQEQVVIPLLHSMQHKQNGRNSSQYCIDETYFIHGKEVT